LTIPAHTTNGPSVSPFCKGEKECPYCFLPATHYLPWRHLEIEGLVDFSQNKVIIALHVAFNVNER